MFRRPLHVIIVGSIRGKGCEAVAGASGLVISKDFINIDLIFRIDIKIRILLTAYRPLQQIFKTTEHALIPHIMSEDEGVPVRPVRRSLTIHENTSGIYTFSLKRMLQIIIVVLALYHRIADIQRRKIKPSPEIRIGLLEICKINLQIGVVFHLYFFRLFHPGLFHHCLLSYGIIFVFRLLLRQIGIQTHPSGDQNCRRQYCCDDIFHFLILHVCPLFASV